MLAKAAHDATERGTRRGAAEVCSGEGVVSETRSDEQESSVRGGRTSQFAGNKRIRLGVWVWRRAAGNRLYP